MAKQTRNEWGLTIQEERFAQAMVASGNLDASLLEAGYSPASVKSRNVNIQSRPQVQARIKQLLAERPRPEDNPDSPVFTAQEILRELRGMALLDPAELYHEDGTLKNIHEMPVAARKAIKEIVVEEIYEGQGDKRRFVGTARKVKVFDKAKSVELAMRHLGILADKLEVAGKITLEQIVEQSIKHRKGSS